MINFDILNLGDYFNNNGFGFKDNIDGDFSAKGLGSVYPSDELPESNKIVLIENIPFLFPSKDKGTFNNFELNNQVINFSPDKYKKIHILSAADTGSFIEKIKIGNINTEFEYRIGFTDWTSTEPCFSEKVAFRTTKIYNKRGYNPVELTIWYQAVDISHIKQQFNYIKFRDNPSAHVFSITLEKWS